MLKPRKIYTVVDPRWWFVCVVASGMEMVFRRQLAKRAILNFAPIKIEASNNPRTRNAKLKKPLFPGYVFIEGQHYVAFRSFDEWKGFGYIINEGDEVYHLAHQIVYDLIIRQAEGDFDLTRSNYEGLSPGDIVDVLRTDGSGIISFSGASVLLVGSKKATLFAGNKVWKIKLCYIRKSVDNFSPFGKAKIKLERP